MLADAFEGTIEPTLVVHDARDEDRSGLGDPLQPRGDVDAVAVNIAIFDDYIARIDADAELDALVLARRSALRRARVPASPRSMRRLYPATSAARMAASRRSTRSSPKVPSLAAARPGRAARWFLRAHFALRLGVNQARSRG
jgi:hypothetical protein